MSSTQFWLAKKQTILQSEFWLVKKQTFLLRELWFWLQWKISKHFSNHYSYWLINEDFVQSNHNLFNLATERITSISDHCNILFDRSLLMLNKSFMHDVHSDKYISASFQFERNSKSVPLSILWTEFFHRTLLRIKCEQCQWV